MNNKIIIKWLKKTEIPLTTISKRTGISRSTLYNWLEGLPIRKRNYEKLINIYNSEIELSNTNIKLIGENKMDAEYIIELQKDKIDTLQQQIENKDIIFTPHPEAFNNIMKQLESATNVWNWVFCSSPTPMIIIRNSIIANANYACQNMFKYNSANQLKTRPILDFVHEDNKKMCEQKLLKKKPNIVLKLLMGNGEYCKVKIKAKLFTDAFGNSYSVANFELAD